jgi:hypothetical protein
MICFSGLETGVKEMTGQVIVSQLTPEQLEQYKKRLDQKRPRYWKGEKPRDWRWPQNRKKAEPKSPAPSN